MSDDRLTFDHQKRLDAERMGADGAVRRAAHELYRQAYRHNFTYLWSWLGVPVIQSPDDVCALQELIWSQRPQVIVETGVARGGSVVLSASILALIGEGRVVGVDVDIRAHNRASIAGTPVADRIVLIEGDSIAAPVVAEVRRHLAGADRVMVVLDSNHTHEHVLAELRAYAPMVTPGQSLIVADTAIELDLTPTDRVRPWGQGNNPMTALRAFLAEDDGFEPDAFINSKLLLSSNPEGYLRRKPL